MKIQVDTTKLNFNVKAHRGEAPKEPVWAITIVDTSSKPAIGYAAIVQKRDSETLLSHIEKIVLPGSIISTDEWSAYNSLSNNGYTHQTVCHKYHFVEPSTGVHTQHVESLNNKIKKAIKERMGLYNHIKNDFLEYFMFIDYFKDDAYEKMLTLLEHFD